MRPMRSSSLKTCHCPLTRRCSGSATSTCHPSLGLPGYNDVRKNRHHQAAQSAPRLPADSPDNVRLLSHIPSCLVLSCPAKLALVWVSGSDILRACAGLPNLATGNPELAAQWHPSRNEHLSPDSISMGSGCKVWWLCQAGKCGHDHEWQAAVGHRTQNNSGCPICSGRKPCICNSLAALHPDLISREWDTKVNTVRPEDLLPQSNKAVHWRCSLHDPPHLWAATANNRVGHRTGCPACAKTSHPPSQSQVTCTPHLNAD